MSDRLTELERPLKRLFKNSSKAFNPEYTFAASPFTLTDSVSSALCFRYEKCFAYSNLIIQSCLGRQSHVFQLSSELGWRGRLGVDSETQDELRTIRRLEIVSVCPIK